MFAPPQGVAGLVGGAYNHPVGAEMILEQRGVMAIGRRFADSLPLVAPGLGPTAVGWPKA